MKPRDWALMWGCTRLAVKAGLSANAISVLSVVFAVLSATAMWATSFQASGSWWLLWLLAAAGIELRAFCNLLDGMVAVETRTASPTGELYNEVPDRLSDIVMLIGFGAAVGEPALGCGAACGAVAVAYVRAQAATAGAGQDYVGPMAKPTRMQLIAVACVFLAFAPTHWHSGFWGTFVEPHHQIVGAERNVFGLLLWIIIVGCGITFARRLFRAGVRLREKGTV